MDRPATSDPDTRPARWWHRLHDDRIQCDLCPRYCKLHEGQRGFCFVRGVAGGTMVLTSYGRATGFCIDPVEKKPLYHFRPGTPVLSFGTAGCNLGCRFCQNWDISKARETRVMSDRATPAEIARAAVDNKCGAIAFTYNDPIIFAEYAIDTAHEAHALGIATIAVSNGYITPAARRDFYAHIDAANIDLKAFSEDFYRRTCYARLGPVLDTLQWIHHETDTWLEVTTLLIPGYNDSVAEVDALCKWFREHLGPDVPLHFSAFRPDYKMLDVPSTPPATLKRARRQALAAGLRYVYTGNIHDPEGQSTRCPECDAEVIERDGFRLVGWALGPEGECRGCGTSIAGTFDDGPGGWGDRCEPIRIRTSA